MIRTITIILIYKLILVLLTSSLLLWFSIINFFSFFLLPLQNSVYMSWNKLFKVDVAFFLEQFIHKSLSSILSFNSFIGIRRFPSNNSCLTVPTCFFLSGESISNNLPDKALSSVWPICFFFDWRDIDGLIAVLKDTHLPRSSLARSTYIFLLFCSEDWRLRREGCLVEFRVASWWGVLSRLLLLATLFGSCLLCFLWLLNRLRLDGALVDFFGCMHLLWLLLQSNIYVVLGVIDSSIRILL